MTAPTTDTHRRRDVILAFVAVITGAAAFMVAVLIVGAGEAHASTPPIVKYGQSFELVSGSTFTVTIDSSITSLHVIGTPQSWICSHNNVGPGVAPCIPGHAYTFTDTTTVAGAPCSYVQSDVGNVFDTVPGDPTKAVCFPPTTGPTEVPSSTPSTSSDITPTSPTPSTTPGSSNSSTPSPTPSVTPGSPPTGPSDAPSLPTASPSTPAPSSSPAPPIAETPSTPPSTTAPPTTEAIPPTDSCGVSEELQPTDEGYTCGPADAATPADDIQLPTLAVPQKRELAHTGVTTQWIPIAGLLLVLGILAEVVAHYRRTFTKEK